MQRTDVCTGPGPPIRPPYMPEPGRPTHCVRTALPSAAWGLSTRQLPLRPLFGILGDALRRYDTGLTSAPA